MSFFSIRDSSGTTQLVVLRNEVIASRLSALSEVPVESTVQIEGKVRMRPENSRRPVSHDPLTQHIPSLIYDLLQRNLPAI
jgi:aspartyl-tRNA synthetase